MNEPIFFEPIAMERVWGGRRLESLARKNIPPDIPIGELWEIVDRPEAQSVVAEGKLHGRTLHDLWKNDRPRIFGPALSDHPSETFPLLVKILDAAEKLSVQVHPPLEKARELGGEPKTEVWYFWETSPNAAIYAGLKKGTTRQGFEQKLREGGVESALHEIPVHAGESIFIPSGRIHAIGAGNLIIEIQQNSDTTYRVFDWNRVGLDGRPRALHIAESMASINFEDYEPQVQSREISVVADSPLFRVEKIHVTHPSAIRPAGGFAIAVPLDHPVVCGGRVVERGRFFLIPAGADRLEIHPSCEESNLLFITLPQD